MGARLRSWWQIIKRPLVIGIIAVSVLLVALIVVEVIFYGTGFKGKTLWDWMQLLFIPVVLAIAGFWFNHRERKAADLRAENERKAAELRAEAEREIEQQRAKTEREIAEDNQREAAIQAYINDMSELLLHENLRGSKENDEVRSIARVRTISILFQLDARRIGYVFSFLNECGLMSKNAEENIVSLRKADLTKIDFSKARLIRANLSGARLIEANLSGADLLNAILSEANLNEADLSGANLIMADLRRTNLSGANLRGAALLLADLTDAIVSKKELKDVQTLRGATMPDGSIHE